MNKRMFVLWIMVFIILGVESAVCDIEFFSGKMLPTYYGDEMNHLYFKEFDKGHSLIYQIDLSENKAKCIFKQKSVDGGMSIGNNEICFRHEYYPTISGEIGPNRYFTASLYNNGRIFWKPRTGIQIYYRQKEVESWYYVRNKLFVVCEPTGGNRTKVPYKSSLFIVDQNTRTKLCEIENVMFMPCSTGFILWPSDQIERPDHVLFFDTENETLISIPEKIEHIHWSSFIAYDSVLYYSSGNQVFRFDENTKEKELIKEVTSSPDLCFSDGKLYIYDFIDKKSDKKVYVYDPVKKSVNKEYNIPMEAVPQYGVIAISNNKLVVDVYGIEDMFSYNLEQGTVEKIEIIR